jgi:quinolinate synthase
MAVNAAVKAELEALFTSQVNADFINSASEESAFMRMARRLPNMSSRQTRLPVMSALPIVYWVTEFCSVHAKRSRDNVPRKSFSLLHRALLYHKLNVLRGFLLDVFSFILP